MGQGANSITQKRRIIKKGGKRKEKGKKKKRKKEPPLPAQKAMIDGSNNHTAPAPNCPLINGTYSVALIDRSN